MDPLAGTTSADAVPQSNGTPVTGPIGGPLPPASMPMKPHLPPPEVSAVRDEEPSPSTAHHLPSDDRATAAAAAAAADPVPSTHPLAEANAADHVTSSLPVVQPPAHESDARGLNGSGVAGTSETHPSSADVKPQPQSDTSNGAASETIQPATSAAPVVAPGTGNPYNASEEASIKAEEHRQTSAISTDQPTSQADNRSTLPVEPAASKQEQDSVVPSPLQTSSVPKNDDVEMRDVPTAVDEGARVLVSDAKEPTANVVPAVADATSSTDGEPRRDSMSVDGSQLPLAPPEATEMTPNQIKACQSAIKGLKGRTDSSPFHYPVDPVALNIPHYRQIVTHPMDLGTVDIKLALTAAAQKGGNKHTEKTKQAPKWNLDSASDVYRTLEDFEKDVRLVFSNCVTFNGPDHPLSQTAQTLDGVFEKQIKSISASVADEIGADVSSASLSAAGRRPSEVGAASRPKRDVHPPPPKDLPYADRPQTAAGAIGKRRKSRGGMSAREQAWYDKLDKDQLKYCLKLIDDFHKSPLKETAWVFFEKPGMDLEFAQAYYAMIRNPISLKEIRERIVTGEYEDAEGPKEDMNLMFNNCFMFNEKGSSVYVMGEEIKRVWEAKLEKMPRGKPPIVDEDDDDDDEELEEEEDEDNELRIQEIKDQIAALQSQLERLTGKGKSSAKKTKKRRPSEGGATAKKAPAAKKAKSTSASSEAKKATAKPKKVGVGSKRRDEEIREVTYEQKEELAAKITQLPDDRLDGALKIIAEDKPPNANEDEEIELDIDDLSPQTLYKLYRYVVRPKGKKVTTSKLSSSDGRKRGTGGVKRKNLDESEEAARIARLQAQLDQFDAPQTLPAAPSKPAAGHDDLVASDSSSGEEEYESESDYE